MKIEAKAMRKLVHEKLLREMSEEIFTSASSGHVRVDQEDLEAAEETLAVQESSASYRKSQLQEFVRGVGPTSGVRAMPEYKQFLDFVMNRNLPGIHPDDVLSRWRSMFPGVRLSSGQIEQLHAALADDGALDQPTYESKKASGIVDNTGKFPFTQTQLSENKVMRRFSKSLSDQELKWHRDREDRVVRMVEGKGWYIQLDGHLPRRMRLGESYHIPAESWHRVIRREGASDLSVIVEKVAKKGAEVMYKGRRATVKVPNARGPFVGIDPAGPDDMKMVPGDELEEPKKKKTEAVQVEGLMDEALDDLLGDVLQEKKGKKKGLWANIHAKRARGERPAKPGEKGYPGPGALDSARGKD